MKLSLPSHHAYLLCPECRCEVKRSDVPLLDQRQVLTKVDLDERKASRKEEGQVIKPISISYVTMKLSFSIRDGLKSDFLKDIKSIRF